MNKLDCALELASKGFYVHPLRANQKIPSEDMWQIKATRDHAQIRKWWDKNPNLNVGIAPEKFGDDEALLVVDIDNRDGKKGDETILRLEFVGKFFPPTFTQLTPTGGRHLIYRTKTPVKKSTDSVFGKNTGVDILSRGSNLAAKGSTINGKPYTAQEHPIAEAPEWLVEQCGRAIEKEVAQLELIEGVDRARANTRAIHYLMNEAPLAVTGAAGDPTTFAVAAKVKDFGCAPEMALELMFDFWNDRCSPPWSMEELNTKVQNAYNYGKDPVGIADPAADFDPVTVEEKAVIPAEGDDVAPVFEEELSIEKLNEKHAWVLTGGGTQILWETTDKDGKFEMRLLKVEAFHDKYASKTTSINGQAKPVTRLWMKNPARRSYDGLVFSPGKEVPSRFYNLWRGFDVEPLDLGATPTFRQQMALDKYLDHVLHNVCDGDRSHFRWIMGWCAHLIQRPYEKPRTAIVLQGGMGTGKNVFLERIGNLFRQHFVLTENGQHVTGHFNAHLQHCLLLGLNEAFWSGNKDAEAILKGLITENTRLIERKGQDPYTVDNVTRVIIMGNDDWVAPVAKDDRRFAVFEMGNRNKQDDDFFGDIVDGMDKEGGNRLLLRYLMDFDLSTVNINKTPKTNALYKQKIRSLSPLGQWWHQCMLEGRIVDSEYQNEWTMEPSKDKFREAFSRHLKSRNINARIPAPNVFSQELGKCCPSIGPGRKREGEGCLVYTYRLPTLEVARQEWEAAVGHKINWEESI